MISLTCAACGKSLRVKDEMAGKSGKCPCGAVVKIPAAAPPGAVAPAPMRPMPAAGFETPAPDAPASGRGGKLKLAGLLKNKRLVMGAAAVALVCLAAYAVATLFLGGGGGNIKQDLPFLPSNTQMVFSVRTKQALDSSLYAKLVEASPDAKKGMEEMPSQMGFDTADVERMTMAFDPKAPRGPIVLIRFNKPLKFSDIKDKKKPGMSFGKTKIDWVETKVKDHTIHQENIEVSFGNDIPASKHKGAAYCLIEDKLALVGGELDPLKAILERDSAKLPEGMEKAMALVDFSKTMAGAVNIKGLVADEKVSQGLKREFSQVPGIDSMLGGVEIAAGEIDIGSDVNARGVLVCKDAKTATEIKDAVTALITVGKMGVEQLQMPKDVAAKVKEVLAAIKLSASGTEVHATVTIPGDTVVFLFKQFGRQEKKTFNTVGEKLGPTN